MGQPANRLPPAAPETLALTQIQRKVPRRATATAWSKILSKDFSANEVLQYFDGDDGEAFAAVLLSGSRGDAVVALNAMLAAGAISIGGAKNAELLVDALIERVAGTSTDRPMRPGPIIARDVLGRGSQWIIDAVRDGQRSRAMVCLMAEAGDQLSVAEATAILDHLAEQHADRVLDLVEVTVEDVRTAADEAAAKGDPNNTRFVVRYRDIVAVAVAHLRQDEQQIYFHVEYEGFLPASKMSQIWALKPR